MLVVDSTQTANGATRVTVSNVGGQGELTQGNGIAVVELLNKTTGPAIRMRFAWLATCGGPLGEERLNEDEPLPAQDQSTLSPSMGWGRVIYRSGKRDGERKMRSVIPPNTTTT
ncbi:Outer membrane autotransporter barrel [Pseudomonas sp. M47T1]|nr:Outer membrane autotransporter barrel [Pseudomonas sp. M47T1]